MYSQVLLVVCISINSYRLLSGQAIHVFLYEFNENITKIFWFSYSLLTYTARTSIIHGSEQPPKCLSVRELVGKTIFMFSYRLVELYNLTHKTKTA